LIIADTQYTRSVYSIVGRLNVDGSRSIAMMVRELKPFIPSGPDFAKAKAFFQDLGFELKWEVDGLAQLSLGGATFLLQDFHNQEMQDNLMMFVSVDDLDEWWRHLQA
jgi:hypothetical protein